MDDRLLALFLNDMRCTLPMLDVLGTPALENEVQHCFTVFQQEYYEVTKHLNTVTLKIQSLG